MQRNTRSQVEPSPRRLCLFLNGLCQPRVVPRQPYGSLSYTDGVQIYCGLPVWALQEPVISVEQGKRTGLRRSVMLSPIKSSR